MTLRFKHPSIAAVADDSDTGNINYSVPSIDELRKWSDETFSILDSDDSLTLNEVVANIKPSPLVQAYYLPQAGRIVLHTSHWRTDGYGALLLLGAYFEALASDQDPTDLIWGQEVGRLAPSVEDVLGLPEQAEPSIKEASKRYLNTASHVAGSIGVGHDGEPESHPGGTRGELLKISAETSKRISEACSRLGISLLAAVHATIAAVNHEATPVGRSKGHYTSTMRFSLRPYLPEPYNTSLAASGLYTGGYLIKDKPSGTWLENARHYHHHYEQGLDSEFLAARRQYAIDALALFQSLPKGAPRSEIDISSVGDAELLVKPSYHCADGNIDVLDVTLGVDCVTPQLYLFYWTFRGCMSFQLVYNESYHQAERVRYLLDTLERILLAQCEVKL
jgi:hypothetical protein